MFDLWCFAAPVIFQTKACGPERRTSGGYKWATATGGSATREATATVASHGRAAATRSTATSSSNGRTSTEHERASSDVPSPHGSRRGSSTNGRSSSHVPTSAWHAWPSFAHGRRAPSRLQPRPSSPTRVPNETPRPPSSQHVLTRAGRDPVFCNLYQVLHYLCIYCTGWLYEFFRSLCKKVDSLLMDCGSCKIREFDGLFWLEYWRILIFRCGIWFLIIVGSFEPFWMFFALVDGWF